MIAVLVEPEQYGFTVTIYAVGYSFLVAVSRCLLRSELDWY